MKRVKIGADGSLEDLKKPTNDKARTLAQLDIEKTHITAILGGYFATAGAWIIIVSQLIHVASEDYTTNPIYYIGVIALTTLGAYLFIKYYLHDKLYKASRTSYNNYGESLNKYD